MPFDVILMETEEEVFYGFARNGQIHQINHQGSRA